ncbi:MAG: DNA alkylation repair protein [Candidatus Hodarchaeota archaeon]
MISVKSIVPKVKHALLELSKTEHRYPDVIAQAQKVDWHEDFSSGYKGLYYFLPLSLSPNYKRRVRVFAVDTPMVRRVSSTLFQELKAEGIRDVETMLSLCDTLLEQWSWEYRTIAFDWSFRVRSQFEPRHFPVFHRWAKLYLSTWGSVDDFCTHTMGYFFFTYPEFTHHVKNWATSENPWIVRAAAVSLIYGLRRGVHLKYIFDVADAMLLDPRKYIQTGYGWMLKEATKHFQAQVFEYVMQRKDEMPRRALRYAIEKMPKSLKARAMT